MKIIISPSKTQKIKKIKNFELKELLYKKETDKLIKIIKKISKKDIKKIMKISDKLTDEIYHTYETFYENEKGHAANSYTGIAYKALNIQSFSDDDVLYLEDRLVILSALYGVLTPLTSISPYRLDMTMSILEDISLYAYWENSIDDFFKNEDVIINLASKEYSKMIKRPMIDIEFFESKNEKLVQISTNSKKARGEMARLIIKNRIEELDVIKNISFENYKFNKKLSLEKKLVFIR